MSLSKRSISDAKDLMAVKNTETDVAPTVLTEQQLMNFGNYGGTTDIKERASYLAKKGLIGASQLIMDNPDVSTKEGLTNSQADWKTSAMGQMLMQARKLGIRNTTEVLHNKDAILSSLDPRIKDAIKHPTFNSIHPNWWQTFNTVLADQYANEAISSAPKNNLIAKK